MVPFDGKETAVVNAMVSTLESYTRNISMLSYTVGAQLADTKSPVATPVSTGRRLVSVPLTR